MKYLFLLVAFLFLFKSSFCQSPIDNKWGEKYLFEGDITGIQLVNLIDSMNFVPYKRNDLKMFKTIVLQLSTKAYHQISLDSKVLCLSKHEEYFVLWNMYYIKISKSFYDEHCMALMALMYIDGIANPPK